MDDSQTFLCNSCVTSLRDCLGWVDSAHPLSQSFDGRILLAEFIQKITGDEILWGIVRDWLEIQATSGTLEYRSYRWGDRGQTSCCGRMCIRPAWSTA